MTAPLFPFAEYWWFYAAFTALVIFLVSLDLGVFHRRDHAVGFREAAMWCVVWVSLALAFNAALYYWAALRFDEPVARRVALEFLAGYLVEESLSLDNIFVFVMLFRYFAVEPAYQHRVLFYGILGAIGMRGLFIAVGAALMDYHWVVIVFGVFLVVTGVRMLLSRDEHVQPEHNPVLRLLRRLVPITTERHGHALFARTRTGTWAATPLLVTLVCVETTDLLFAIDSVPAVFALTREPLIVFTSNIFAILGLRSLYFLLAGAVDRFHLLKFGLAFVLMFVGAKMAAFPNLPITVSLAVIAGILALSIAGSLCVPSARRAEGDLASTGTPQAP